MALLEHLGLDQAIVVGHSSGASIACSLVETQPRVVRHALIYEPPLLAVVPHGQEIVGGLRERIEQAMAEGGPRLAMERFMRGNAGDAAFEQWRATSDPATFERILDNGAVFFSIEMPAFVQFMPDCDAMRASGVPLTLMVGAENRSTWLGAAAAWLIEQTGADRIELPGGHAAFATHPAEFVNAIRSSAIRHLHAAEANNTGPTTRFPS